jgi:hypothetical protein
MQKQPLEIKAFLLIRLYLALHIVPQIRYLGFTLKGTRVPWLWRRTFLLASPNELWYDNQPSTIPFYRITLGFNLRAHHWGFVQFFIHPLLILARSTSFRTNSCGFSYYLQFIPPDLDPVGFYTTTNSDLFESWHHDRPIQPIPFLTLSLLGRSRAGRSRFSISAD